MMKGIKPGDAVYLVGWGKGTVETVAKVGQKFFYLETSRARSSRFHLDSGCMDKGHPRIGRCWKSQDAFEAEERRDAAWVAVSLWFRSNYRRPDAVTEADIRVIAKIIGVEL